MKVRIETLTEKHLIGKAMRMSLTTNKTPELWQGFMADKKAITNAIGTDLYSIQLYDDLHYFKEFNPRTEFTKWAAIEVANNNEIPHDFKPLTIEKGCYAVFLHKGPASAFQKTFQFIFTQWLPQSGYEVDCRPHFEVLGKKYKNNHPDSEEEVWIPIRKK